MKIAIIGAGKVGMAVGFLLKKAGYELEAFSCRENSSIETAGKYLGEVGTRSNVEAARLAEMIFITTPDSRISNVCNELVDAGTISSEKTVVHMGGALGLEELEGAKRVGAKVFCAHPLQTFPAVDAAIKSLPKSYFGITAESSESMETAKKIVKDLGGFPVEIPNDQKPLYHAAACMASNYLVALMDSVKSIGDNLKLDESALSAYLPLVKTTLNNIEEMGTQDALTGPIARGDIKTIEAHVEKLSELSDDLLLIYKSLGRHTVGIALKKGTIDESTAHEILRVLSGK
jgi:predicted short-subunit dehydrogenase-like oxidoreductase (DUF2520 family)